MATSSALPKQFRGCETDPASAATDDDNFVREAAHGVSLLPFTRVGILTTPSYAQVSSLSPPGAPRVFGFTRSHALSSSADRKLIWRFLSDASRHVENLEAK